MPQDQGLYRAEDEKDACGLAVVATLNGTAVVVAGQPGQGRSAYLGPTYFYNNSTRTTELDRLLEQAVADHADDAELRKVPA